MKFQMLLIRRCAKDPTRKQRVPFLVSRRRLERALDRICRRLDHGGSLAFQPGGLMPGGYVDLVKHDISATICWSTLTHAEGAEPEGLQVHVVEQQPWAVGKGGTEVVCNVGVLLFGAGDGGEDPIVA